MGNRKGKKKVDKREMGKVTGEKGANEEQEKV